MRKIFVILLIGFFIINSVAAAFLFLDIQIFKAPVINVELDPVTFSPSEILVQATVHISNPNPFDVSVKNFRVTSLASDGYEIGSFFIAGGDIPANRNQTFIAQDSLGFAGHEYTKIKNRITTNITISIFGIIRKTIPFEMTVDASLENITKTLVVPNVHLELTADDIDNNGVHFSGSVELYNQNQFEITAGDLSLWLRNEKNESLGSVDLEGGTVEPAGFLTRSLNGTVLYKALDAQAINATFAGVVGVTAIGINKTLPFALYFEVAVPDFLKLLDLNRPFMFNLTGNFKIKLRGVVCYIDFAIYNPSKIPLEARDLVCSLYRMDKNTSRLLGRQNMSACALEPKQEECVGVTLLLTYRQFLFSGAKQILPDWFILTITTNISLSGINRSLPVAVTGYLEPHFIFNATANPFLRG